VRAVEVAAEVLDLGEAAVLLLPRHGVHRVPHAEHLRRELIVGGSGGAAQVRIGRRAERGDRRGEPEQNAHG